LEPRDLEIQYAAYKACKAKYPKDLPWDRVRQRITLTDVPKRRLRAAYTLAAAAVLFTAFTVARVNHWPEMYEYARQGDYRKVLAIYANAPIPMTPYERVQAAYTEYYSGNLEKAEKEALALVDEHGSRTHALYLLGCITRDMARHDESHHYLRLGYKQAQANSQHQLKYLIACYLARSFALQGDFETADHFLDQAYLAYENDPKKIDLDNYLFRRARIHLLKGEFEEAICYIKAQEANAKKMGSQNVYLAYAELALIYGILGDPLAAYYHEEATPGDMFESERQHIWRKLRQLAVAKASGFDTPFIDAWRKEVEAYAALRDNLEIPLILALMEQTYSRRIDYECEKIVP
jgi:hypothetical protein